jgi:hypothetical protein
VAITKKVKALLFPPIGTKAMALVAFGLEILALASFIMGVISAARKHTMWLDPYSWLYVAIALFIYGLWWWLTAYFSAKD